MYSVFLVCLSSHFEKLGQSDLDKKIHIKSYRKSLLLIHHQADFNEIQAWYSSKKGYCSFYKSF